MSQNENNVVRRIVKIGGSGVVGGFVRKVGQATKKVSEKYLIPAFKVIFAEGGRPERFIFDAPFQVTLTSATALARKAIASGQKNVEDPNTYLVASSRGWKAVTIPETDDDGEKIMTQSGRAKQIRLFLDLEGKGEFTHKVMYQLTVMAKPLTEADFEKLQKDGKVEVVEDHDADDDAAAR
jgi:hypothetical protein